MSAFLLMSASPARAVVISTEVIAQGTIYDADASEDGRRVAYVREAAYGGGEIMVFDNMTNAVSGPVSVD